MRKRIVLLLLVVLMITGCSFQIPLLNQTPDFQEVTVDESFFEDEFYYQGLDEDEQLVYREIYQGVMEHKKEITVHYLDGDRTGTVFQHILYDLPELFWVDGSCNTTTYENSHTVLEPVYVHSLQERETMQKEIDSEVTRILSQVPSSGSDYDKVKYLYETLVNEVAYVVDADDNQNIYSAFVGKETVCAGYARANEYLLEKVGIDCIYVVGTADGQSHAWNIVECNGKMYCVDVTWADPLFAEEMKDGMNEMIYDFLCCSKATLSATHQEDAQYAYPECTSEDLDYYRMNDMFYETIDRKTLLNKMYDSINAKQSSIIFKFGNHDVYGDASELLKDELIETAAEYLCRRYDLPQVDCYYKELPELNRFVIYWNYN